MTGSGEAQDDIRPGDWMSWRPGHLRGLVHRLLLDDTGELAAVVLEADGGGWIAAAPGDLAPLVPRDLN